MVRKANQINIESSHTSTWLHLARSREYLLPPKRPKNRIVSVFKEIVLDPRVLGFPVRGVSSSTIILLFVLIVSQLS